MPRLGMRQVTAYAPGHITGLFQICDQDINPLRKGARGSGVSIDLGVYTRITMEKACKTSWNIKINGHETSDAFVSENVLMKFENKIKYDVKLEVEHFVETPMIAGFGSSGGGAISLALALNEACETELSRIEAAQIAHVAEIECKTGLGSVFAAEKGGFGVLTRPGAPGIGEATFYTSTDDLRVIYLYLGPIHTRDALSNPSLRAKINELGGNYVNELCLSLNAKKFMKLSRNFTEHVGLVTPRLRSVLNSMDELGYVFTMAMFGEVAFTIIDREMASRVALDIEKLDPSFEPIIVGIDNEGARLIYR